MAITYEIINFYLLLVATIFNVNWFYPIIYTNSVGIFVSYVISTPFMTIKDLLRKMAPIILLKPEVQDICRFNPGVFSSLMHVSWIAWTIGPFDVEPGVFWIVIMSHLLALPIYNFIRFYRILYMLERL